MQHYCSCGLLCVSAPYTQPPGQQAYPGQVAAAYNQAGAPAGQPQQQQQQQPPQQYPSYAQPAQGRQYGLVLCGHLGQTSLTSLVLCCVDIWDRILWPCAVWTYGTDFFDFFGLVLCGHLGQTSFSSSIRSSHNQCFDCYAAILILSLCAAVMILSLCVLCSSYDSTSVCCAIVMILSLCVVLQI